MAHRILIVDDEESSRSGLKTLVDKWGYEAEYACSGHEALEKAPVFRPDVVITDMIMPELDGLTLLKRIHEELPFISVILLTGHATIETAVAAIKQGAFDYISKPVDIPRLKVMIEKAIEKGRIQREMTFLRHRLKHVWGLGKLVGSSPKMQEVYSLLEIAAPTPARVLILGESGTGKELVAQSIHEMSPRKNGPFLPINCSAIPENLLESEIFGYEKGAFTGAVERKAGCFEMANEGTIFLDEVAEMSPPIQAKFLRILEDGTVKRIGGNTQMKVDVRVIAATNKDPLEAIQAGTLREDLFYRLEVCTITLPPLRVRKEDIPLLVQAFIEEFNEKYQRNVKSIDDLAQTMLVDYTWPGNVRELRNTIERAVMVCNADLITSSHLLPVFAAKVKHETNSSHALSPGMTIEEVEKKLILETLASVNNNKTQAAALLGITIKTLHNKLHRYET